LKASLLAIAGALLLATPIAGQDGPTSVPGTARLGDDKFDGGLDADVCQGGPGVNALSNCNP
jgi:hypothetical protein